MKHILLLLLFAVSAIAADAQLILPTTPEGLAAEQQFAVQHRGAKHGAKPAKPVAYASRDIVERPRFGDNWSLGLYGGVYHPTYFAMKYLVDCSGIAGSLELRKQLTPVIGLGLDVDGYYRMTYQERQDPRTLVGPALHINLMNLFGGYKGRPRVFELDALVKPAWGHLYRGTGYEQIPDENYFATKYGLDFNFNLGRDRQWTLSLRPSVVFDVDSKGPKPGYIIYKYDSYTWDKADLQLFLGATYHFRGHDGKRHFRFATPVTDRDELDRLNEVVNFLRDDVEARDRQIRELKQQVDSLRQQK